MPIRGVKYRSCPRHIGVIPLCPTNLVAVRTELRVSIEIGTLSNGLNFA